ncbi:MAG: FKBP-type peptidyl-prolyl cis-trans isomerase [Gemmatimonadetes bacterium]|nr:FKBP-type peptidyl-prolyl cis-trans isomerase [Gemmatimonadota bacterium]MXX70792.1 FKBP-type peptidyl-prolyl cis-trans isomerase [Gemmatimonadota bacterium]MYC92310.1 FKBP-type peptidyl-prolyl cis-trans isomerase [Gemmatimonadota bacterium]MYG36832.1 FKBP-type peptidyl-prolyl cis-trans isomerase [Gemmatimonadota bacterium]MYJ18360.1 FKBP-type peptidyl-prolyl cis-trans isomerase [Gemmatimonadota bacterium]
MKSRLPVLVAAAALACLACAPDEPEVFTTESGLQYEVLREADGPSPTTDDRVVIHYRGTLTDGTQFDSSYDRGEPSTFPVSGVIPGFGEALQLMSVGSQIRVTIPPDLAYGSTGAGDAVPPDATLIFEIELLEIEGG